MQQEYIYIFFNLQVEIILVERKWKLRIFWDFEEYILL